MSTHTICQLARVAATAMVTVVLAGCGPAQRAAPPPPIPEVAVLTTHRTSVPVAVELPGREVDGRDEPVSQRGH